MLRKEIINNLNKNYLRMECDANENMNKYEYKMMNVDNIIGLLPCHVRFINGTSYLYYEITATNTFFDVYNTRAIEKSDLKKLAHAINNTILSLENYLLEGENIVFDPEFIFMDTQTEELFFIYYPYYGTLNKENFTKLAEFLTEHIDHDDIELLEKTYQLYEQVLIGKDKLPLKEVFSFLETDALIDAEKDMDDSNIIEYIKPEKEELKLVMEETLEEKVEPIKIEKPAVLSLFEVKKGKIRQKRIAYAVEEGGMKEAYSVGYHKESEDMH